MEEKDLTKRQKRTALIISLVLVLALVLGISYAYFAAQGQSTEQSITTSNMGIEFGDGTAIVNASGIAPLIREVALPTQDSTGKVTTPGKAVTKKFTIENTGTEKMYIHISLEDMTLPTNLKRYDFMWSLYEVTDTTNNIEKNVSNGSFDGAGTSLMVAPYQVFEVGDEKTYNLYIWIEETHLDQSIMMGQTFKATIQAEGEVYWTSPESDFVVDEVGILTAYTGSDTDIIIPPVVNGVTVARIEGLSNNNITSIVIPNTVISIGAFAFDGIKLTSLFIPNSGVEVETGSFAGLGLTQISLPNNIHWSDGQYSLFSGNNFTSIYLPNSTYWSFGEAMFGQNANLKNIIIPNNVTIINGVGVFANTNISTLVIPSSVTEIEYGAFMDSNITQFIVLGKSSAPEGFMEGWEHGAEVIYKP